MMPSTSPRRARAAKRSRIDIEREADGLLSDLLEVASARV